MNTNNSSRYPFTPSQWQELEQQALIYKYMATGIPIPSDLLLPLKRSSFFLTSTQPPPTMGWTSACYHIGGCGLGRRAAEDPEPGRCRRTDGKKWRCSKEAYADSKYCERHMHRGKNRSRKPVEISLNSAAATAVNSSIISGINASNPCPLLCPHSSWELRPLELGEPRQREREEERGKHCFVLGADFKMERPVKERDFLSFDVGESNSSSSSTTTSTQPSPSPSSSSSNSNYSKTQLSISIPMGLHDFPHWLVSCGNDENGRCPRANFCSGRYKFLNRTD